MAEKYMAYVGSYSYLGKAKGITCYDVDVEKGHFTKRCEVEVDNSSYVINSHTADRLYSIADEGVVAFRILKNGTLQRLNSVKINGLRGCHLSISPHDKYICVSGYHDGKMTILEINPDGSMGKIKYEVYDSGYGSVAERNFRPHVTCSRFTPDCKYIMSCDSGIDQVKIFKYHPSDEVLRQVDAIRCERGSSPRFFRFSPDGKYLYLIYEIKNVIEVYTYDAGDRGPVFEKIQTIGTTSGKGDESMTAACAIRLTRDGKNVLVSNAGENTVTIFSRDEDTGLLTYLSSMPISGDYPKDISLFPDGKHLAVANHQSNEITFFKVDYERGLLIMSDRSVEVNQPNCVRFVKL
ncbi:MAG: beta-propeller fold lactonase family protein [Eubacteriales bacterium]|nr:beta-propeller fold lactonase family protein [Eubacteriales bacterium]